MKFKFEVMYKNDKVITYKVKNFKLIRGFLTLTLKDREVAILTNEIIQFEYTTVNYPWKKYCRKFEL